MDTVPYESRTYPPGWVDPRPTDKQYTVGDQLMCDFHFGGKPRARCIEVLEEGTGRCSRPGKLRVQLMETVGAYHNGEILEINCFLAVPCSHTFTRGYYGRVRTNYHWVKTKS